VYPSTAILAAAGMLCCALSGCSVNSGALNVPTVSSRALQEDISRRLADAGEKPESVICQQDLVGEVGATARCVVVVSTTNSFEPIVTVVTVDGAAIDYALTPAVSRQQLQEVVSRLVVASGGVDVGAVSCASGVEGRVGAVVQCDVDANGVRSRRVVRVTDVHGLMMDFEMATGTLDGGKAGYGPMS
jgi:hypothetical protein